MISIRKCIGKEYLPLFKEWEPKLRQGNSWAIPDWVRDWASAGWDGAASLRESKGEGAADAIPDTVSTANEEGMGELENEEIDIIPLHKWRDPK